MDDTSWLKPLVSRFSCEGYLLNSGTFSQVVGTRHSHTVWNQTMSYPAWYVNCTNANETVKFIKALADSSQKYTLKPQKNDFMNGNLVIAFLISGVCIGGWMLFLLLFLLPSTNHNRQHRMVHLNVLYFSIVQSVTWKMTNDQVFAVQYKHNYQNSNAFYYVIFKSRWFRVLRFFQLLFCDINWVIVIYYLCQGSKVRSWRLKGWPVCLSNSTNVIVTLSVSLSVLHVMFFGINLFYAHLKYLLWVQVPFRITQIALFTIFLLAIIRYAFYSLHSVSSSMDSHVTSRSRKFMMFLQNYKETIPLLIYNITVYLLLYAAAIVQMVQNESRNHWIHSLIAFLRILVFVNAWGLIGKLEKREREISKKSLLGRRIDNRDRFFVDPKIDYVGDKSSSNKKNKKRRFFKPRVSLFHSKKSSSNRGDTESSTEYYGMQDMDDVGRVVESQSLDAIDSENDSLDTMLTRNVIYEHSSNWNGDTDLRM